MKEIKFLLTCMGVMLLFVACHRHEDEEENKIRQTVIVYMSGENNLASFIESDLREMQDGSKAMKNDERLVAFVDGISNPYIIELKNGVRDTIKMYDEDFYACDPERFYEILKWIENKYPAEENNFGLVLWGHGSGWLVRSDSIASTDFARPKRAWGQDTGKNLSYSLGTKWINITQMRRVFEKLPKFRFIFTDCCCMMAAEVVYELRNSADYLFGSPSEIPGNGAPYHLIVSSLFGQDLNSYKDIIDTYYQYYLADYKSSTTSSDSYLVGNSLPFSIIDTKYMEDFAQATRNILMEPEEYRLDSIAFYYYDGLPALYDMGSIMKRHLSNEDYAAWRAALDKAVPYRLFSNTWMTIYSQIKNSFIYKRFQFQEDAYGGLSVHIPKAIYNFNPSFNDGLKTLEWYKAVGWERY